MVIQNKLNNKQSGSRAGRGLSLMRGDKLNGSCRRGLSLMLPLGLRSSGPSPRADAAHPRLARLRRPFGGAFSATRLALPVSFLMVLSFLYINIYVGNALMNSSAVTENHEVVVQDNNTLGIEFVDNEGNVTADPTRIEITPTADGAFNSGDVNVRVHTNSDNGYTLTMSATTTSLSGSVADSGHTIPTLLAATSEANFPNNYWGYKRTSSSIADTLYNPMVANVNIPVSTYGSTTNGEISKVNFGVKLDNLTPSDSYSINIAFAAVTNIAPNLYYMQDATSTSLAVAMPSVGDTTVLYDRRDNKEYTIAKLADGKYWMTKNLDLGGGTPLYSSDSDVPAGYDVEPYYTLPQSSETGFNNDAGEYVFNSSNKTDSCGSGCYSYYSWTAAVAGNKTNVNADVTEGDVDTDAPYSICPAGWKLPTSRHDLTAAKTSSDFYQMAIHYGLNPADVNENSDNAPTFCSEAGDGGDCGNKTIPNFLRAGRYYGSTFDYGGSGGFYWSSTASSSTAAHYLLFSSDLIYSAGNTSRMYGFSVRCLFDATMQNFTSEDAAAMALHQEEVLVDARDGKTYYVTKLKDGNVWMTQNLDLDLSTSTTLTHANTDLGWTNLDTNASWTPANSTINNASETMNTYPNNISGWASGWNESENTPSSVDAGYKYILPIEKTAPGAGEWNDQPYDTVYNSLAECQAAASDSSKNSFGLTCDGHTSVGNYYNFAAANATNNVTDTLGSGKVVQNAVMPDSICPAGWRLPKDNSDSSKNEFAVLLGSANYNLTSSFNPGGLNTIRKAPLYFVRSGHVIGGSLHYVGVRSGVWSSTISGSTPGYHLGFDSSGIGPATSLSRVYGFLVRCLLRTE